MATLPSFVGIILSGEKTLGSGFIIAPEHPFIVTATHVINQAGSNPPIAIENLQFQFLGQTIRYNIKPLLMKPVHQEDITLLELSDPLSADIDFPTLLTHVPPTSDVSVIGYVEEKGKLQREYKSAQGKLKGITKYNGTNFYELEMQGIYKGMSGTPVMVNEHNIIGVLTDRVVEGGLPGGHVTPIEYVIALDERIGSPRTKYLNDLIISLTKRQRKLFGFDAYASIHAKIIESDKVNDPEDEAYEISKLYEKHDKLMLVGSSGSGKSTTLRYLAIQAAQTAIKESQSPIPIFIDLEDWIVSGGSFENFLGEQPKLKNLSSFLAQSLTIQEQLSKRKIYLFMDGLDELEPKNVRALRKWTEEIDAKLMLTCREHLFQGIRKFNIPSVELQPLNPITIFEFAQAVFRDDLLADEFTSHILPTGWIENENKAHVSQLARHPFFLSAMLENFQRTKKDDRRETDLNLSTQWNIFNNIFENWWHSPRIQELLSSNRILEQKYTEIDAVIKHLSPLTSSRIGQNSIPINDAESAFGSDFIEVLDASRILSQKGDLLQFPHQLFADYVAAHSIDLESIDNYLEKSIYRSPLSILSTQNNANHKVIQSAILRKLRISPNNSLIEFIGEIGNEQAIQVLLDIQSQYFDSDSREAQSDHDYFKQSNHAQVLQALAKIANRLPDNNQHKKQVLHLLQSMMLNPKRYVDENGQPMFELGGWFTGLHLDAAEAISHIHNHEALDALLAHLDQSARIYETQLMGGQLFREQWSANYLNNLGGWAVPRLLKALNTAHPEVASTIAKAILQLNRPIDIDALGKILLTHHNPIVRARIAITLGKYKKSNAIPYLERALKDEESWAHGGVMAGYSYEYAADSAAASLAHIGTEECKTILKRNLYDDTGNWTDELLIYRLDNHRFSPYKHYPLQAQIAASLAARNRLGVLLPRLSDGCDIISMGFQDTHPIALALIRRFQYSQPSDSYQPRLQDYIDITPTLIAYLNEEEDVASLGWVLVILGKVGNQDAYPELIKYISHGDKPELYSAAAYGLGSFVKRHHESIQDVEDVYSLILDAVGQVFPTAYGGVGYGLSEIISVCGSSIATKIKETLIQTINSSSLQASKTALDALEIICLDKNEFIDEQVQRILDVSPSYHMKLGNRDYRSEESRETHPALALNVSYDSSLALYTRVLECKKTKGETWASKYSESDWGDLGCGDGYLYHQIAKIQVTMENWLDAAKLFEKSYNAPTSHQKATSFEKVIFLHSMLEAGNIASRFLDMPEIAMHLYASSLNFALDFDETAGRSAWFVEELYDLFLYSMNLFLSILIERELYRDTIEVGLLSLDTMNWARQITKEESANIYASLFQSAGMMEDTELAFTCIQEAHDLLRTSPRQLFKASTYLHRAQILIERDLLTTDIRDDLLDIRQIFEDTGDMFAISQVLYALARYAHQIKDYDEATKLYQESLSYLNEVDTHPTLEQKVVTLHHIALTYQEQGFFTQAQPYYEKLRGIIETNDIPPNVAHTILSDYAKLLHFTGKHDEAMHMLTSIMQERLMMGLGPGTVQDAIFEIDTEPGCKMPATVARNLANITNQALHGIAPRQEILAHLESLILHLKEDDDVSDKEIEYVSALYHLLQSGSAMLPEENPYQKYFSPVKDSLS